MALRQKTLHEARAKEAVSYITLYTYIASRNYGVMKENKATRRDWGAGGGYFVSLFNTEQTRGFENVMRKFRTPDPISNIRILPLLRENNWHQSTYEHVISYIGHEREDIAHRQSSFREGYDGVLWVFSR